MLVLIVTKSFGPNFNLKRHVTFDDDEKNPVDEEENESDSERAKVEHSESKDDRSDKEMSSNELEDNAVFLEWLDRAKDTREIKLDKYEKYIAEDMENNLGREGAYEKLPLIMEVCFTYAIFKT